MTSILLGSVAGTSGDYRDGSTPISSLSCRWVAMRLTHGDAAARRLQHLASKGDARARSDCSRRGEISSPSARPRAHRSAHGKTLGDAEGIGALIDLNRDCVPPAIALAAIGTAQPQTSCSSRVHGGLRLRTPRLPAVAHGHERLRGGLLERLHAAMACAVARAAKLACAAVCPTSPPLCACTYAHAAGRAAGLESTRH